MCILGIYIYICRYGLLPPKTTRRCSVQEDCSVSFQGHPRPLLNPKPCDLGYAVVSHPLPYIPWLTWTLIPKLLGSGSGPVRTAKVVAASVLLRSHGHPWKRIGCNSEPSPTHQTTDRIRVVLKTWVVPVCTLGGIAGLEVLSPQWRSPNPL